MEKQRSWAQGILRLASENLPERQEPRIHKAKDTFDNRPRRGKILSNELQLFHSCRGWLSPGEIGRVGF